MANTKTLPVLAQKKAAVTGNTNASLIAAIHNATTDKVTPTPEVPAYTTPTTASTARQVTKFEFRQLFTLAERIQIDNAGSNMSLTPQARGAVVTLLKDLEVSGVVDLDLPQLVRGVQFLVTIGLLTANRAAQILANHPAP
jgi:hypothetical protein